MANLRVDVPGKAWSCVAVPGKAWSGVMAEAVRIGGRRSAWQRSPGQTGAGGTGRGGWDGRAQMAFLRDSGGKGLKN